MVHGLSRVACVVVMLALMSRILRKQNKRNAGSSGLLGLGNRCKTPLELVCSTAASNDERWNHHQLLYML